MRQHCVTADFFYDVFEASDFVERRADHRVADVIFDRDALAGKHRFIHRRVSLHYFAVDRNGFARSDQHRIALHHLIDWDIFGFPVSHHARGFRLQFHQFPYRVGNLAFGFYFEPFAENDESDKESSGFEIYFGDFLAAKAEYRTRFGVKNREIYQAVEIRGGSAYRDQAVHIERFHFQAGPHPPVETGSDVKLDRRREDE